MKLAPTEHETENDGVHLTAEQITQIRDRLRERGAATNHCPVCNQMGTVGFIGETAQIPMTPMPGLLFGAGVTCVLLVCNNCGYTRVHALHALGLGANPPGGAPAT